MDLERSRLEYRLVIHDQPTMIGRAWTAGELRNKSFEDLHKLWWICAKEKNKLISQQSEAKALELKFPHDERLKQVHKSMKRIKGVLHERRIAYITADGIRRREELAEKLRNEQPDLSEKEIAIQVLKEIPITTLHMDAAIAGMGLKPYQDKIIPRPKVAEKPKELDEAWFPL
jgi:hypothetical protein